MKRGKKKVQVDSIKEIPGAPEVPKDIASNPKKLAAWNGLLADLADQGNLLKTDRELIALTARTLARLAQIEQELDDAPSLTHVDSRGDIKQHPAITSCLSFTTKVNKLLSDLRLTPGARTKGVVPLASEDTSGWEA